MEYFVSIKTNFNKQSPLVFILTKYCILVWFFSIVVHVLLVYPLLELCSHIYILHIICIILCVYYIYHVYYIYYIYIIYYIYYITYIYMYTYTFIYIIHIYTSNFDRMAFYFFDFFIRSYFIDAVCSNANQFILTCWIHVLEIFSGYWINENSFIISNIFG